jgi:DNA-directed RNA polymerase specialized sigma24 family protein/type VI protein secretion system component VasF
LSEPATGLRPTDRPTIDRARHFEHAAIASILDRCLDPLYGLSFALTGAPQQAETVTLHALMKGLDALRSFRPDESEFQAWLMRTAARAAALSQPSQPGLRQSLTHLTPAEYELVALRVFAGLSTELLAHGPGARQAVLRAQLLNALRLVAGEPSRATTARRGQDLAEFDAAVDRVVAGETPEQAATTVTEPTDVLARLRTVTSLRRVPCTPLGEAARERINQEVLAAAQERRVHWVQGHQGSPKVPGLEQRRHPRPARGILTLGVGLVLAALVGTTLAVVSSFADPDSLLYPLKRLGESVLVAVTQDRVNRAELEVKLSQSREREAEDMASRGKGSLAVQAVRDRVSLLQAAATDLSGVSPRNSRWTDARNQFLNAAGAPLDQIEHDLDVTGQPPAAEEVRRIDVDWVHQQAPLRQSLGQPAPAPSAPPPAGG